MITTSAVTYGAEFDGENQAAGIEDYIGGGDYTAEQRNRLGYALFEALRDEVDALLPRGVHWVPRTSEFVYEIGGERPPAQEDMRDLFDQAWPAVVDRFDDIEREALS